MQKTFLIKWNTVHINSKLSAPHANAIELHGEDHIKGKEIT